MENSIFLFSLYINIFKKFLYIQKYYIFRCLWLLHDCRIYFSVFFLNSLILVSKSVPYCPKLSLINPFYSKHYVTYIFITNSHSYMHKQNKMFAYLIVISSKNLSIFATLSMVVQSVFDMPLIPFLSQYSLRALFCCTNLSNMSKILFHLVTHSEIN